MYVFSERKWIFFPTRLGREKGIAAHHPRQRPTTPRKGNCSPPPRVKHRGLLFSVRYRFPFPVRKIQSETDRWDRSQRPTASSPATSSRSSGDKLQSGPHPIIPDMPRIDPCYFRTRRSGGLCLRMASPHYVVCVPPRRWWQPNFASPTTHLSIAALPRYHYNPLNIRCMYHRYHVV
jgi:hypothetical protein